MPIKPELRYYYPIDWPQVSRWVRFVRARGRCETCGRPHGETVRHLGDGRWWDEARQTWRDGRGREIPCPAPAEAQPVRATKVVLARRTSITILGTGGGGTATSGRSASGVICSMTGPSTAAASGSPCVGEGPWATCSQASIRADQRYGCP